MPDADWVKYKPIRGKSLPETAELLGSSYALQKTLKKDFYAACGVYGRQSPADPAVAPDQVLLKIYHTDRFGPLRLRWLGRWLARREIRFLETLKSVPGIPRLLGLHGEAGIVREYVPGCNLREFTKGNTPDAKFFPRLRAILDGVHRCSVSHNDLSKPENVLVTPDGSPVLIDFQIALKIARPRWSWLPGIRQGLLRYMQRVDGYHLLKLHRRIRPMDFTAQELQAARRKGLILTVHGWIRRPYRAIRHFVLRKYLLAK
jgi:serine/threonine protein kinase